MSVRDIYTKHPYKVHENITIKEVLTKLLEKEFNGVLIVNDADELVGMVGLQDILAAIVPVEFRDNLNLADAMHKPDFFKELCSKVKNKKVKEIMQTKFSTVDPDASIMKVAADFANRDLSSHPIPVIENGKVIGIITRSEIKKALAEGMDI